MSNIGIEIYLFNLLRKIMYYNFDVLYIFVENEAYEYSRIFKEYLSKLGY